jgi:alpha-L-arabinofuranosidase
MRKGGRKIKSDDKEFDDYVVQNYLDLIEFANGNPEQNKWAKLRADMGHPEPFGLDRIGIGNENFGKLYLRNFDKIEKAIHAKYPDIICILSAGPIPFKWLIAKYLKHNAGKNNVWSDVHSYHSVKWFLKNNVRFDRYNRASKIYFGEYSANGLLAGKKMTSDNVNQYDSALAEAVFLTGLERNGDVVIQSSYAPLFNMAGCEQWLHNLIDFNQQCWCPTVNYLVQKLFATNTASRYLPFTSNVPLPKTLCVSATGDSERVYIKVVNSGSDAVDVQLALNDTQDSTITVLYLQSNDVKVRNMLGFNGLPVEKMSIQEDTAVCKDGTIHATIKGKSVTVFRSCIMKRCEF